MLLGKLTRLCARQLCTGGVCSQILALPVECTTLRAFHMRPTIPFDAAPHELITGEKLFGAHVDCVEPVLDKARALAAPGQRSFHVPVACHVAFYCTDTCNINVVTGEEHEAVLVQASWLEGKEQCNPLFTFRQLDAELEIFQWRRLGKEATREEDSTLTVHIPERFCSLTILGGDIKIAKVKEAGLAIHTTKGSVAFGTISATHAQIISKAGSVTGGSLTAADVLVAAGGDFTVDKLTGLRMDIVQGGLPGGRVHIGAAYCDKQLHIECRGASEGMYLGSLSTGEGGAALVQQAPGRPVELGGFEGACLGIWANGGPVGFHALRAARRIWVDSNGGDITGDFVRELHEGAAAAAVLAHTGGRSHASLSPSSPLGRLVASAAGALGLAAAPTWPPRPPGLQPGKPGSSPFAFQPRQLSGEINALADAASSDESGLWRRVPMEETTESGDEPAGPRSGSGSTPGFDAGLGYGASSGEGSRGERRKAALDALGAEAVGRRPARVLLAPGGGRVAARKRSWKDAWLAGLKLKRRD